MTLGSSDVVAQQNPSNVTGGTTIDGGGYTVWSDGWVENFNASIFGRCNLTGAHEIRENAGGTVASKPVGYSRYEGTVQAAARDGRCYRGFIHAECACTDDWNDFQSAEWCAKPAPCVDQNQNGVCDNQEATTIDPGQCTDPCTSPIVINLQPGPYTLTGVHDPVEFDIDADGGTNRITWTAGGTAVAFLALDRNGTQEIGDGSELFGTATPSQFGGRAANGFEALREFDSNGDGLVSSADERWGDLLLWIDGNHDGLSQPRRASADRRLRSDLSADVVSLVRPERPERELVPIRKSRRHGARAPSVLRRLRPSRAVNRARPPTGAAALRIVDSAP